MRLMSLTLLHWLLTPIFDLSFYKGEPSVQFHMHMQQQQRKTHSKEIASRLLSRQGIAWLLLLALLPQRNHAWIFPTYKPVTAKSLPNKEEKPEPATPRYNLAVVGGGVVGVQAALTAAQRANKNEDEHFSVILIDAPAASGVLMNGDEDLSLGAPTGLFSKALRDTSKRIQVSTLRGMGLREDSVWNEIVSATIDLAASNAQDIRRQLEFAGVTYEQGFAQFVDGAGTNHLCITKSVPDSDSSSSEDEKMIQADKILVATGSKPFLPDGIPFDGKRVFDSDSINTLSFLPKSIAITGSGIIAIEFARIFRNLGAEVTLIIRDKVPRNALMKIGLDIDVAASLVSALIRSGIQICKGAQVRSFDVPNEGATASGADGLRAPIKLQLENKDGTDFRGDEVKCDIYLAAVGRKPNTDGLNLKAAGIEIDEYGGILVNGQLQTTASNVYAAGDVLGRPFLASTGVAQAQAATNTICGGQLMSGCAEGDVACIVDGLAQTGASFDPASLAANPFAFPTGVWTSPEAAYYGLTSSQAQTVGMEQEQVGEAIALYAECLRGRVFNPNGLLKLVYVKPAGRILGVHIVGQDACEMIHYGMELVRGQRTIEDLLSSLYSAVTFHELYKIAAEAAMDPVGGRRRRAAAGKALAARNRQVRKAS